MEPQSADKHFYSCSATQLSPTVLVTAAHGDTDDNGLNPNTGVTFTPKVTFENRSLYPSLIAYFDDSKNGRFART